MSTDFPTAPLAPGHKGAGGGTVEKSHHASHTKNLTLPDIRLFDMEMGLDIQFIPKLYR